MAEPLKDTAHELRQAGHNLRQGVEDRETVARWLEEQADWGITGMTEYNAALAVARLLGGS